MDKKKILAAAIMAALILPPVLTAYTAKVYAVSAARVEKEDTFVPYVKAIIQFNYTTTTTAGVQTISREYIVGIGDKAWILPLDREFYRVEQYGDLNDFLKSFTMRDLIRAAHSTAIEADMFHVTSSSKELVIENHTHAAKSRDKWSVDDLAPGIVAKWFDNDRKGYQADTTGVEISVDLSVDTTKYWYIELYDFETNATGSNSILYIGWENSTDGTVVYDSGHINTVVRRAFKIYYLFFNVSARPDGTNAKILKLKLVNMNAKKIEIVYRDEYLADQRSLTISVGPGSVSAQGYSPLGSWYDNFWSNALQLPNLNLEKTYNDLTDAWGWFDLDQIAKDIGESLAQTGEKFQDYSVQAYDLVVETGQDIGEQIMDTLEDASESVSSTLEGTAEVLQDIQEDTVHSITLAVDIASDALEEGAASLVESASNVIDMTYAGIASVSQSISGGIEWVVDSVNGFTKQVSSGIQHFTDGVTGLFNSIGNWFNQWWWAILLFGILIFVIVVLIAAEVLKAKAATAEAVSPI